MYVQVKSLLPHVNKDLFLKLQAEKMEDKPKKKKKKEQENLLEDDRFATLFTDQKFEVSKTGVYILQNTMVVGGGKNGCLGKK